MSTEQDSRVDELEAEIGRLRAALEHIAYDVPQFTSAADFNQRVAEQSLMWALVGLGVQPPEAYGLPADVLRRAAVLVGDVEALGHDT